MKMEKELKPLLLTITLAGSAGPIVRQISICDELQLLSIDWPADCLIVPQSQRLKCE